MRLLVVEDERPMAEALRRGLSQAGYVVDVIGDGADAVAYLRTTTFDAIVLDVMLPTLDGFGVVAALRTNKNRTPVLMLTARGDLDSRIQGLDTGADDYLVKPFELEELLARIRALLRRAPLAVLGPLRALDLTLDPSSRLVQRGGVQLALSARESQLLEFLLRHKNRVMNRQAIFERVWANHFAGTDKVVDVYMNYLRGKVDKGFEPKLLHTVRGHGYVLRDSADAD